MKLVILIDGSNETTHEISIDLPIDLTVTQIESMIRTVRFDNARVMTVDIKPNMYMSSISKPID